MLMPAPTEDGFTIVELLVTLVLLAMLFAVASRAMVDTWHSGKRSTNTTDATGRAAITLDFIGRDVRATQSPARASSAANNDQLRGILLTNTPPKPTMQDIPMATAIQLKLRADVVQEPLGAAPRYECIDYHLDATKSLVRDVYQDWNSCAGTLLSTEILLKGLPKGEMAFSAANPLFTYTLVYNPLAAKPVINPDDCRTYKNQPGPGTGYVTNRINGVHVNLKSFVAPDSETSGRIELVDDFDVVTRTSHDYMFSMGCAF